MRKTAPLATIMAALLGIQPLTATAQNDPGTNSSQSKLHLQVVIVPVVVGKKEPSPSLDGDIIYSIPTRQVRLSVTEESWEMELPDHKGGPENVLVTTIVAE
jgi:hypothetical protein